MAVKPDKIRRILIAVKNTAAGRMSAVDKGIQLARKFGAAVELFHAISDPLYAGASISDRSLQQLQRAHVRQHVAQLDKWLKRRRIRGVQVSTAASWDYPAHEAIIRRARSIGADLIIVEAHTGRRMAPWLLHLTDWELLRHSPVPVLVVKRAGVYSSGPVLAALDPSRAHGKPAGLDAVILSSARKFAAALGGPLHAMHAWPAPSAEMVPELRASTADEQDREAQRAADAALRATVKPYRISANRRHLTFDHPIHSIPKIAASLQAQLIVLGAVSRSGLQRVFIGNTAEDVLADARRDVLVVKPGPVPTSVPRKVRGVRLATPVTGFSF